MNRHEITRRVEDLDERVSALESAVFPLDIEDTPIAQLGGVTPRQFEEYIRDMDSEPHFEPDNAHPYIYSKDEVLEAIYKRQLDQLIDRCAELAEELAEMTKQRDDYYRSTDRYCGKMLEYKRDLESVTDELVEALAACTELSETHTYVCTSVIWADLCAERDEALAECTRLAEELESRKALYLETRKKDLDSHTEYCSNWLVNESELLAAANKSLHRELDTWKTETKEYQEKLLAQLDDLQEANQNLARDLTAMRAKKESWEKTARDLRYEYDLEYRNECDKFCPGEYAHINTESSVRQYRAMEMLNVVVPMLAQCGYDIEPTMRAAIRELGLDPDTVLKPGVPRVLNQGDPEPAPGSVVLGADKCVFQHIEEDDGWGTTGDGYYWNQLQLPFPVTLLWDGGAA